MQSSAAVAGRALLMLACVVGIPAWALSGASWPEMVKKLQDFRWPAILNRASASSASATSGEAPRFAQSRVAGGPSSGHDSTPFAQIGGTNTIRPISATPSVSKRESAPTSSGVVPVGYQTTLPANVAAIPKAVEDGSDASTLSGDPFQAIPQRLRELGATYYLLEAWGSDQQMYRFYCKMAVGGSADYTRCFEASHGDPLQAMRQVLQEVETWRGAGRIEDVSMRN
jgi:hypothetical protein